MKDSFPSEQWQVLLELGKHVLSLPGIDSKLQVIEETANQLLKCKTIIILNYTYSGNQITIPEISFTASDNDSINEKTSLTHEAPLIVRNNTIGVIQCRRNEICFSDSEINLIKSLATQTSISIEYDWLLQDLQNQVNRLSSVAEISNVINSILDVDILLNSIVGLIHRVFNFQFVYLFTINFGQKILQLRAESTGNFSLDSDHQFIDLHQISGVLADIIDKKQTVLITDQPNSESPFAKFPPVDTKSELCVPLTFGGQTLGIICIRSELANAYDTSDAFLLKALGDNIAVALRNANLYSTEQWRRQVTESMHDVAGLLSADVDLEHLLNQLLAELAKTLPCDIAAIWLLNGDNSNENGSRAPVQLTLAAILSPDDSLYAYKEELELSTSEKWLEELLAYHYPIIHEEDDTKFEPFGKFFNYTNNYSAIFCPLRIGLQPLGILVLTHPTPGRYGSEAQLITATFASYTSVAIKNNQLYEAAHDQAWIATVLLQVADATQSINNLSELIQTVVNIIPQLVGVFSCAILLWEKNSEMFIPSAAYGLNPEQKINFDHWFIPKGAVPVFDAIITSHEPIIVNHSMIPDRLNDELFNGFHFDFDLFVLFPLISQADILGAILVDFSHNSPEYDDDLWEEKYSIIQGITHQTAVAIENIRLIQSQEEEAYVSIALLQVAQAIVSSPGIEDILSVITRITPLLVAMRRCVIFLWDFDKKGFVLDHSFGISKSELLDFRENFNENMFPLLETVLKNNQIICHIIRNNGNSLSDFVNIPSDQCLLLPPIEKDDDQEHGLNAQSAILSSQQALLLAYPLSVKQTIYGVMITEEELLEHGAPTYHLRERRMEIVIGITQQAALALQNDFLQREALQRERFDRELQLAREIQMNFMPDILPSISGWDLATFWQPARQVGGDYYDVFELPDGHLGLVIADVADKGMPAAIFMTLVRTLLKASIRGNNSPGAALKEVNDLLVPDAKNGMFVTLVFGVLNPKTGTFIYANAGHVPPMKFTYGHEDLLELYPTSMALGVLSGIPIQEHEIQLHQGDGLILFTDGVSEAFSPEGDMYGVIRLKNILLESDNPSAAELINTIVQSINDFTRSATLSDDLTLVTLYRNPTA